MRHWLVLSLGLAVAAAAGYAIVSVSTPRGAPAGDPLDRIDDPSRDRLERVLREAEPTEAR